MNEELREIPDRQHPLPPATPDLEAAMKNTSNGPRFSPADLQNDPKAAHDALLHWDVQSEQILRLLAQHPEHGGRLEKLQRADGWLRQRAADTIVSRTQDGDNGPGSASPTAPDAGLACPTAGELYDFASGPGSEPLPRDRHLAIDRHLAACESCDSFVATLAIAPPALLLLGDDEVGVSVPTVTTGTMPEPTPVRHVSGHRFPARRVLIPLAAAAAIVLAIGVWRAFQPVTTMRAVWPEAPLLRGETADALVWPRGRVLERSEAVARLAPALASAILFELEAPLFERAAPMFELEAPMFERAAPAGSESSRVQVLRTAGGAFDVPTTIAEWSPTSSTSASPIPLPAGHYTWKAWTRERGLDVELGSRDFEVVHDAALLRELSAILESGDEDADVRAVAFLDARGFRTDARVLARSLPASPGRDAYLGRAPGR